MQLEFKNQNDEYMGNYLAFSGKEKVGEIQYWFETPKIVNVLYIGVNPQYRNLGVGTALNNSFKEFVKTKFPQVKEISMEVTSQGAFNLAQKVYGEPNYIADPVDELSKDDIKRLPGRSPENEDGIIEDAAHISVKFPIAQFNGMQKKSYHNENAYLRDYLRTGFDLYDYTEEIVDYLIKELGEDVDEFDYDAAYDWLDKASEEEKSECKEWVINHTTKEGYEEPAYQAMSYEEYIPAQWLVHFTDSAYNIAKGGFEYGHEGFEGLHLTTWKKDRANEPGYNFAFEAESRYARNAAMNGKYGKEAVVFWGDGVKTYHVGDEEDQIVFYGPSVNKNMIFPIYRDGDQWQIRDERSGRDNKVIYEANNFNDAVNWVINNFRMLETVYEKYNKKKKQQSFYQSAFNLSMVKKAYDEDYGPEDDYEEEDTNERLGTKNIKMQDLIEIHKLEYQLHKLLNAPDRRYIENSSKLMYMQEKFFELTNKVLQDIKTVFECWLYCHKSTGWLYEHMEGFMEGQGRLSYKNVDIMNTVKARVLQEISKNPKILDEIYSPEGHSVRSIMDEVAFNAYMFDIVSENKVPQELEEFLSGKNYVKDEEESLYEKMQSEGWDYEFSGWLLDQGYHYNDLGLPLSVNDLDMYFDEMDDGWFFKTFIVSEENTDMLGEMYRDFMDQGKSAYFKNMKEREQNMSSAYNRFCQEFTGPFFYIFQEVVITEGFKKWNDAIDRSNKSVGVVAKADKRVKRSLKQISEALKANDIGTKSIALTLALNTAHVSGDMSQYMGLDQSDLRFLSNMGTEEWDTELSKMSSIKGEIKMAKKRFKKATGWMPVGTEDHLSVYNLKPLEGNYRLMPKEGLICTDILGENKCFNYKMFGLNSPKHINPAMNGANGKAWVSPDFKSAFDIFCRKEKRKMDEQRRLEDMSKQYDVTVEETPLKEVG